MLLHWVTLESFCISQITKELVSGPTDPRNLSVWWWWGGSVSVVTLAAFFPEVLEWLQSFNFLNQIFHKETCFRNAFLVLFSSHHFSRPHVISHWHTPKLSSVWEAHWHALWCELTHLRWAPCFNHGGEWSFSKHGGLGFSSPIHLIRLGEGVWDRTWSKSGLFQNQHSACVGS